MPCMCGDLYCNSCGPAQGNSRCYACGKWEADGGCTTPAECASVIAQMEASEAQAYAWEQEHAEEIKQAIRRT